MKKLRPTIPIFEWRIATHLDETRNIQNQDDTPAYACDCEWCKKWKAYCNEIMPEKLQRELKRIGVELERPTDLYKYGEDDNGSHLRVVYHAVGKILSGPNQWKEYLGLEEALMYHTIREEPYFSIVVFPQSQSFDAAPALKDESAGDLIRIDFRLCIPKK